MTVLERLLAKPEMLDQCIKRVSSLWPIRRLASPQIARSAENRHCEPLIFFVHVPKTAGSSVNAALHEALPDGFSHCEAFIGDADRMRSALNSCGWLSGHVDLSQAEKSLAMHTRRPIRYFACMRNPTDQVRSHYNWLIEIFHRGEEFYETHSPAIKAISEAIRTSPKDAASIKANLHRFGGLLLNTQSTYILGHAFDWNTGDIKGRLGRYEMIADSTDVQALLSCMLGSPSFSDRRENVSCYHFDPDVFDSDEMTEFLQLNNARDESVYRLLGFRGNS